MNGMLEMTPVDGGYIISVKAFAGAKRNEVNGVQDGALKVYVTQIPEKGKANAAIKKVLVKTFKLKNSQVELVSGETSPLKKFFIQGIDASGFKFL